MLDFLRRKTQSYGTYLILGLIIVTFVISFGPASNKVRCGVSHVLAEFDGSDITVLDWRYATSMASYFISADKGVEYRRFAMDKLLERKMLANLAHEQGIRFMREDAENLVLKNHTIIFGQDRRLSDLGAWPLDPKTRKPAHFNYEQFKEWVRYRAGFTDVNEYLDQLVEEMEAKAYRDAFLQGSTGSMEGQWVEYQVRNVSMWLKKAEFTGSSFEDSVSVSDGEAKAMLSGESSRKQCEDEYNKNKDMYEKGPKQRTVKAVVFKMSPTAAEVFSEAGMVRPQGQFQGVTAKDFMVMDAVTKAKTLDASAFPEGFTKLGGEVITMQVTRDGTMGEAVFGAELKKLSGPVSGPNGIYFFVAESEKQITYGKDEALLNACKALIRRSKAEKKALEMAQKALKQLEGGAKPEDVFGKGAMPQMMEVGPVSPLKEQPPLFTKQLVKELWALKEGQVLPKVETRDMGMAKVFYVLVLSRKKMPDRQEFMDQVAAGTIESMHIQKTMYALEKLLYKRCKSLVRKGELTIEAPLYRYLYYRKPADADPKELAKMPPEKYSPCLHISSAR